MDALAAQYGGHWRRESKQQAELARVRLEDSELWLLKPTGYMNRSGAPVAAVANFYRIAAAEILVAHDDIDLPPGVVPAQAGRRPRWTQRPARRDRAHWRADFWRLRFGVGHPGAKELVIDAVLDRPTAAEQPLIDAALERALSHRAAVAERGCAACHPQAAQRQSAGRAGAAVNGVSAGPWRWREETMRDVVNCCKGAIGSPPDRSIMMERSGGDPIAPRSR